MDLEKSEHGELIDDFHQFFAPASTDLVSSIVARYNSRRVEIEQFHADYEARSLGGIIGYFCRRNGESAPRFDLEHAICGLNSDYWKEALALTDVYDAMPQKRRDDWNHQMGAWREPRYKKGETPADDLPDFDEDVVRATLLDLLASREKFFAERVDGLFRTLSKAHVTNTPQGFSKRMIIGGIFSYGSPDWQVCGYINDLRCVIARFMGRDQPGRGATEPVIRAAIRNAGEWMSVDGGALRIRVYTGVGTAHLEVHPDMAWRLNGVLASLYPAAIPESFRRKPVKAKKIKDFVLFERPLAFAVVSILVGMEPARAVNPDKGYRQDTFIKIPKALMLGSFSIDKALLREVESVLFAIGAVKMKSGHLDYYQFDYDFRSVLDEIVCSGCIPDHKSYQFYPTPEKLARIAVEMADIEDSSECLEPSAGIGGIADLMPVDRTTCVEFSGLHCEILKAKGFKTIYSDFLPWANSKYRKFDRVVMNPPYSEGRWKAHTEAAAELVNSGGNLVAILPSSARNNFTLDGFDCEWSQIYANEFAGTSVSVAILLAKKK